MTSSQTPLESTVAENLAAILYDIAKDQLEKKQYSLAVQWLERSLGIFVQQSAEVYRDEAKELKLSVLHDLVKAHVGLGKSDAMVKAHKIVDQLESEYGDRPVILLLKLDLIAEQRSFDGRQYFALLQRLMRILTPTEMHVNMILYQAHRLRSQEPALACKALDEFLQVKVMLAERPEWIEKVFVTRLWMSTTAESIAGDAQIIAELLTVLSTALKAPLSASASHAAHVVSSRSPRRAPVSTDPGSSYGSRSSCNIHKVIIKRLRPGPDSHCMQDSIIQVKRMQQRLHGLQSTMSVICTSLIKTGN